MREINKKLEKDQSFDIIEEMRKIYIKKFKDSYLNEYSFYKIVIDVKYKPIFKETNDYKTFVQEQNNYEKFKGLRNRYVKKNRNRNLSGEFRTDLIQLTRLEASDKYESRQYLQKRLKEKFDIDELVFEDNYEEKKEKFLQLWLERERSKKSINIEVDFSYSEEENNYNYSSYSTYNNYNDSDNSYKSSYSSSNKSSYNNTYSNEKKNNTSSHNNSNQKKRIKVIVCYSCKSKNLCPLCGIKMTSRVSLGNLYAHPNCYNEGTCVVCNKKGSGNQVQSICLNCRKNGNGKGLTGSAKCFVCRKLIN